jgi:hypothetical protein
MWETDIVKPDKMQVFINWCQKSFTHAVRQLVENKKRSNENTIRQHAKAKDVKETREKEN